MWSTRCRESGTPGAGSGPEKRTGRKTSTALRADFHNTELANLCPDILDTADTAAHTGLHRIGSSYQRCVNFLDHTGLRL
ncbi:hypothetical protein [Dactylosporangium sp. NPDC005555]|uniref:hypothetical protein n=1 Tax=Dactylosporangium sp. NPDC005555 TaxID=3154889 RepID=UPI0033B53677